MTECAKIRRLLALQRADWSVEERRQVEAHLAGCEQCTAVARAYAEQDRWSRAMPPVELTPLQRGRVLAVARAKGLRPARIQVSTIAGSAALVALIGLLALGLASLLRHGRQQEPGIGELPSPAPTSAPGERVASATAPLSPAPTVATPLPGSDLGKLAWVQDGDIWIRVLPDGGPVRLTEDGRASEPRWSASGEWLAFRRDVEVWLIRADGRDAYPVDSRGVIDAFAWSPVDDRLAYVAGSGMLKLEVVRPGDPQPLTLLPPGADGQPGRIAWSPDGAWIAYEWRRGLADYEGLWKIAAGGGEPVELYDSGMPQRGEALLAGWTADGQYPLFWQGEMLSGSMLADGVSFYALPASGGQPLLLAGGDDAVLYHDDCWSSAPTGPYVALTVGGGRETWANKRIAVADPETRQLATLTENTVSAFSPTFSPGGGQIAYVAAPDVGFVGGGDEAREAVFQRRIWIVDVGSAQPQQLTTDAAYRDERPLWSADGSHLLFVRMDEGERVSLWLLALAGGAPQQVADGLGPWPGPAPVWFGYYGYNQWDTLFDWWQEPAGTMPPPVATPSMPSVHTLTPQATVPSAATNTLVTGIPTSTPVPLQFADPLVTAPDSEFGLGFDSWSPDSQWIAYWVGETAEGSPAHLTFVNVRTGSKCQHPEVSAQYGSGWVAWQEDDRVIAVLDQEGEAMAGSVCETFAPVEKPALLDRHVTVDTSPDGRYRAETRLVRWEGEGGRYETLTIAGTATGQTIATVSYLTSSNFGWAGQGWLNDELYLIGQTADQGILYVSLPEGRIGHVLPDLIGLDASEEEYVVYLCRQANPATGEYHLLLVRYKDGTGRLPLLLYHSELDRVEELAFYDIGVNFDSSSFTPDGEWLLLGSPIAEGQPGPSSNYWLRPVDPPDSVATKIVPGVKFDESSGEAQKMAEIAAEAVLGSWTFGGSSGQAEKMAFYNGNSVRIWSLPDGRLLGGWSTRAPSYYVGYLRWSPDGTLLAAGRFDTQTRHEEALFVIQVP
jgi:Tol biopolymer transport system component